MSACVPDVSVRLFGFVRVFSLSLCCLPTVMYIKTARFPLFGGFEGSSGQSTLFSSLKLANHRATVRTRATSPHALPIRRDRFHGTSRTVQLMWRVRRYLRRLQTGGRSLRVAVGTRIGFSRIMGTHRKFWRRVILLQRPCSTRFWEILEGFEQYMNFNPVCDLPFARGPRRPRLSPQNKITIELKFRHAHRLFSSERPQPAPFGITNKPKRARNSASPPRLKRIGDR
jgi:hypothetical protein